MFKIWFYFFIASVSSSAGFMFYPFSYGTKSGTKASLIWKIKLYMNILFQKHFRQNVSKISAFVIFYVSFFQLQTLYLYFHIQTFKPLFYGITFLFGCQLFRSGSDLEPICHGRLAVYESYIGFKLLIKSINH